MIEHVGGVHVYTEYRDVVPEIIKISRTYRKLSENDRRL